MQKTQKFSPSIVFVVLLRFVCFFSLQEKAVLEGNLRLSATDGKGKRPGPVMVPKREQVKLDEKKAAFEQLDRQAEQVSTREYFCLLFYVQGN